MPFSGVVFYRGSPSTSATAFAMQPWRRCGSGFRVEEVFAAAALLFSGNCDRTLHPFCAVLLRAARWYDGSVRKVRDSEAVANTPAGAYARRQLFSLLLELQEQIKQVKQTSPQLFAHRAKGSPVAKFTVCYSEILYQASPRPRSANVQAFCRGKVAAQAEAVELCREGLMAVSSQLTAHFAQEFTNLSSTLELKVSEALADHARMADRKMESLIEALQNQRARSESPKRNYFAGLAEDGRQLEANKRLVKRRDEQITQMMLLLEKVETRSRSLERFPDLEAILSQAQEKVEGMDSYIRVALHSVHDLSPKVSSPRSMTGAGLDSQSLQEFRKLRDGTDTTVQ
ncbi:unnamed protein product [Symbiodinium sp. CCMP2592]|nr:unnamed protein product [Symbiodinium sp. CCMP2592]